MHCIFSNVPTEYLLILLQGKDIETNDEEYSKKDALNLYDYLSSVIYRDIFVKLNDENRVSEYGFKEMKEIIKTHVSNYSVEKVVDYVIDICESYWGMTYDDYRMLKQSLYDNMESIDIYHVKKYERKLDDIYRVMNSKEYRNELKRILIYEFYYLKSMKLNDKGFVDEALTRGDIIRSTDGEYDEMYRKFSFVYKQDKDEANRLLYPYIFFRGLESKDKEWYEVESIYDVDIMYSCIISAKAKFNPFVIAKNTVENGGVSIENFFGKIKDYYSVKDSKSPYFKSKCKANDEMEVKLKLVPYLNEFFMERMFLVNFINTMYGLRQKEYAAVLELENVLKKYYLSPFLKNRLEILKMQADIINGLSDDMYIEEERALLKWCGVLDLLLRKQIKVTLPVLSLMLCYVMGIKRNIKGDWGRDDSICDFLENDKEYSYFYMDKDKMVPKEVIKNKKGYEKKLAKDLMDYCMDMISYKKTHIFSRNVRKYIYDTRIYTVCGALMNKLD